MESLWLCSIINCSFSFASGVVEFFSTSKTQDSISTHMSVSSTTQETLTQRRTPSTNSAMSWMPLKFGMSVSVSVSVFVFVFGAYFISCLGLKNKQPRKQKENKQFIRRHNQGDSSCLMLISKNRITGPVPSRRFLYDRVNLSSGNRAPTM